MTCSAGCCTSTGELHERIYAPYELQQSPLGSGQALLEHIS